MAEKMDQGLLVMDKESENITSIQYWTEQENVQYEHNKGKYYKSARWHLQSGLNFCATMDTLDDQNMLTLEVVNCYEIVNGIYML